MTFSGFPVEGLAFLTDLGSGRDKAWFDERRKRYDTDVVGPAKAFVAAMGDALGERFGAEITAIPRTNGSIAPINNDLRFSPDRTPYKDHLLFRFWEPNIVGKHSHEPLPGRTANFYVELGEVPHQLGEALTEQHLEELGVGGEACHVRVVVGRHHALQNVRKDPEGLLSRVRAREEGLLLTYSEKSWSRRPTMKLKPWQ